MLLIGLPFIVVQVHCIAERASKYSQMSKILMNIVKNMNQNEILNFPVAFVGKYWLALEDSQSIHYQSTALNPFSVGLV